MQPLYFVYRNAKGKDSIINIPFKPFSDTPRKGCPHKRVKPKPGIVRKGQIGLTDEYVATRSPNIQSAIRNHQKEAAGYARSIKFDRRCIKTAHAEIKSMVENKTLDAKRTLELMGHINAATLRIIKAEIALRPVMAGIKQMAETLVKDDPADAFAQVYHSTPIKVARQSVARTSKNLNLSRGYSYGKILSPEGDPFKTFTILYRSRRPKYDPNMN